MTDAERKTNLTFEAYTKLQNAHADFIKSVAAMSVRSINGGTFSVADGNIVASTLGVHFDVIHKPVVVNENFGLYEYSFVTKQGGVATPVWHMYLDGDGLLCTDSAKKNQMGGSDVEDLPNKVVSGLANALIAHGAFSPKA
jgi:hypothetical protein